MGDLPRPAAARQRVPELVTAFTAMQLTKRDRIIRN